jgi:2-dehydro-3-deoxygluconokinase
MPVQETSMTRVASIGECMIELSEHADGSITRAYGGDTLNTAVYLARLGVPVDYVTGLGDDPFSDEMKRGWQAEGVGTKHVLTFSGRLPGLYIIQTDARGERRFSHWRDRAPARDIFTCIETDRLVSALQTHTHIYFSGISLSLYGEPGRTVLFNALDAARARGTRVIFDTNYRARGWPDRAEAQGVFRMALQRADIVFASVEDLTPVFGSGFRAELERLSAADMVLKLERPACEVIADGIVDIVEAPPVECVVDTTAAGDSFAAGYLAARLGGASPWTAAAAGHRLASRVVQHRGALIPHVAMADLIETRI